MPTNHDAKAALPVTVTAASKTLTRNVLVKRMPYVVTDAELSTDLVAIDPDTGAIIQDILFLGRVFHYDPTDHTTAHDGTTCLVSFEGNRYKLASGTDVFAYAVIDNTLTAPPGSPSIGDSYLVAAGATGAWSGKDNQVAVRTTRGWEFVIFAIGRLLYVKSGTNADTFYRRNAGGSWVSGFGSQTIGANSVKPSALIGKGLRWFIENQTTNTPPGSPSVGDAYIIGPIPTGAWSGNAGKIAICEVGTSFTIYTPRDGELAYDKALKIDVRFDSGSGAWLSASGAIINAAVSPTVTTGGTSTGGSGSYTWGPATAPTKTPQWLQDDGVALNYTARKTAARLRMRYQFHNASAIILTIGIFRDGDATALDWVNWVGPVGSPLTTGVAWFEIASADALIHTYRPVLINNGGGTPAAPTRRRFEIEEFA